MKFTELDRLLITLAGRIRIRSAVRAGLMPAAVILALALILSLSLKFVMLERDFLASVTVAFLSAVLVLLIFVVKYLRRSGSVALAAFELDRLAGLKERTASLVALRSRPGRTAGLLAVLERDTEKALLPVDSREILSRSAAMPASLRWLVVMLAGLMFLVLVPGRGSVQRLSLAETLVGSRILVRGLQDAAAGGGETGREKAAETARKVLVLIKAVPPRNSEEALERGRELKKLSERLRKAGRDDLADRLDAVVKALGSGGAGAVAPQFAGREDLRALSGLDRYPARYRQLLAAYFEVDPGQEDES